MKRPKPPQPPPDVEAIVRRAESEIAGIKTHEVGIVFDRDGNEKLRMQGGSKALYIEPEDFELFKNSILTHNHPNGSSFSIGDVEGAIRLNVAEIRATGINDLGEHQTHILKRGVGGWHHTPDEAVAGLTRLDEQLFDESWQSVENHEMTVVEVERHYWHNLMTRASEEFQWDYRRVKNP